MTELLPGSKLVALRKAILIWHSVYWHLFSDPNRSLGNDRPENDLWEREYSDWGPQFPIWGTGDELV